MRGAPSLRGIETLNTLSLYLLKRKGVFMSDCDLCSAVFILRPQRMLPTQHRFLGRMAQRLFLLMLNHAGYEALVVKLHGLNTPLPYTVSDLFMNGGQHTWMRVTGLSAELCHAIQHLVERLPSQTLEAHG